jgi:ArsR family transcriptional regulator
LNEHNDSVRELADTFKALSDETRLQMMALLLENPELCVCDFVGVLGLTQSKASRHLRYLYNAGLVKDRRAGVWIHYRLSPDLPPATRALVDALGQALSEDDRSDLRLRLNEWRERRTC